MESEQEPSAAQSGGRRRGWVPAALAVVVLLLVIALSLFQRAPLQPQFVWLAASSVSQPANQSLWTNLRFKVVRLTAPIWRHFKKPATNILLDSTLMRLSAK